MPTICKSCPCIVSGKEQTGRDMLGELVGRWHCKYPSSTPLLDQIECTRWRMLTLVRITSTPSTPPPQSVEQELQECMMAPFSPLPSIITAHETLGGWRCDVVVGGRRAVLSPSQCPIKHGNLLSLILCPSECVSWRCVVHVYCS